MSEKHLISGPVNVARLSGNIFGIDKVLYVYFDVHQPCYLETRCDDILADDIVKYFFKEFMKINKKDMVCDFFLETFPTSITYKHSYHENYIRELRQLVAQTFSYDPKSNKVSQSATFPHVRLHYIDIRDYIFYDILIGQSDNIANDPVLQNSNIPSEDDIIAFTGEVNLLILNIQLLLDVFINEKIYDKKLKKIKQKIIKINNKQMEKVEEWTGALYLINKIRDEYKHNEVKKIIRTMLDNYLKTSLLSIIDKLNIIISLNNELRDIVSIDNNTLNITTAESRSSSNIPEFAKVPTYGPNRGKFNSIIIDINNLIFDMTNVCIVVSCFIIDMYFIRRFLDKDYITNGISYTGELHSMNYIYILVKYFDFKITHASYTEYDIETLNKKIKENELNAEIRSYFMSPNLQQCSDITNFPIEFT